MWERSAAALDLGPPRQEMRQGKHFFTSLEGERGWGSNFQSNISLSVIFFPPICGVVSISPILFCVSNFTLNKNKSTKKKMSAFLLSNVFLFCCRSKQRNALAFYCCGRMQPAECETFQWEKKKHHGAPASAAVPPPPPSALNTFSSSFRFCIYSGCFRM